MTVGTDRPSPDTWADFEATQLVTMKGVRKTAVVWVSPSYNYKEIKLRIDINTDPDRRLTRDSLPSAHRVCDPSVAVRMLPELASGLVRAFPRALGAANHRMPALSVAMRNYSDDPSVALSSKESRRVSVETAGMTKQELAHHVAHHGAITVNKTEALAPVLGVPEEHIKERCFPSFSSQVANASD